MKISQIELRASYVSIKIQKGAKLILNVKELDRLLEDNNQLIAIFIANIKTARKK